MKVQKKIAFNGTVIEKINTAKNCTYITVTPRFYFYEFKKEILERYVSGNSFQFPRMVELIMRFEKPDSKNRWDSPLFTIQASLSLDLKIM